MQIYNNPLFEFIDDLVFSISTLSLASDGNDLTCSNEVVYE